MSTEEGEDTSCQDMKETSLERILSSCNLLSLLLFSLVERKSLLPVLGKTIKRSFLLRKDLKILFCHTT